MEHPDADFLWNCNLSGLVLIRGGDHDNGEFLQVLFVHHFLSLLFD